MPRPPQTSVAQGPNSTGTLAENILYFARALREAGLPVGSGSVIDAIAAVEAAGIGGRADFYITLHSVFVKKHEHSIIFRQAFDIFWRKRGFLEKLIALMSPAAEPRNEKPQKADAGATRVADALFKNQERDRKEAPSLDLDARFTMSQEEILRGKDFAQMSAAEIAAAKKLIARLRLPDDEILTRRLASDPRGARIDPRRTFRRSLRAGGAGIDLAFEARVARHPPIVAICDISGSMSDYTRIFLHFLYALTEKRRRVHTFLFGTRLTNVTRALKARDIDDALALCSAGVQDWSGGTRIARSLHLFNRDWSRRVLGQGAIVLMFTDGLERSDAEHPAGDLSREMERLQKSCRRLVWLNPLLRYDRFEAKATGIRAMLPFVDEFRPIHNLASMADLCSALGASRPSGIDPRRWLRLAA
ncbi:MAG: VWA domain-containing protein [Methylobacteriaceae bacterium]|nr:VWA domain-containing protein [Methylobacteriaceae bacterium]